MGALRGKSAKTEAGGVVAGKSKTMVAMRTIELDASGWKTPPDYVPSSQDLDTMRGAIEAASVRRVTDFVMPNGNAIGSPGDSFRIREVPGGLDAATAAFNYLKVGGTIVPGSDYAGTLVRLPGKAGYVGLRPVSTSGPRQSI